jgi:hypothetical protein
LTGLVVILASTAFFAIRLVILVLVLAFNAIQTGTFVEINIRSSIAIIFTSNRFRRLSGQVIVFACTAFFAQWLPGLVLVITTCTWFTRGLPCLVLVGPWWANKCAEAFFSAAAVGGGGGARIIDVEI